MRTVGEAPLGIDFGTTFSSCAVVVDGRVEFVKEPHSGLNSFPSCVFYDGQRFTVGRVAENQSISDPGSFARWFKRNLGDSEPMLLKGQPFEVEVLISEIFKRFRQEAAAMLGYEPKAAVLSHPATYQQFLRDKLLSAGKLAGFESVELIEEPVAAAESFVHDEAIRGNRERFKPGDTLLVYDLGGGTFDASLYRVTPGLDFEIMQAPVGDAKCGGIDFDAAILKELRNNCGEVFEGHFARQKNSTVTHRFRAVTAGDIIAMKHQLTETHEAVYAPPREDISEYVLTRARYEELIEPIVQQTVNLCEELVRRVGLKPDELQAMLLIGGSSRTPMVARALRCKVGDCLLNVPDRDLAVCRGAALWGARNKGGQTNGAAAPVRSAIGESSEQAVLQPPPIRVHSTEEQLIINCLGLEDRQEALSDADCVALSDRANEAWSKKDYNQALHIWGRVWLSRKSEEKWLDLMTGCLVKLGKTQEVGLVIEQWTKLGPESALAHCSRACGLKWLGRMDESLEAFTRALALEPKRTETLELIRKVLAKPVMCAVPAGTFQMGERLSTWGEDLFGTPDKCFNQPKREVHLDSFQISKTAVSVRQFKAYTAAKGLAFESFSAPPWGWIDNHPMVNISWQQARDFCIWVGGDLPTEAQWEKAARGSSGREFPWQGAFDRGKVRASASEISDAGSTAAVDRPGVASGASPYGCLDMAGNVLEWCLDSFEKNYYGLPDRNPVRSGDGSKRICRGCSWTIVKPAWFRCARRFALDPARRAADLGFRLLTPG